MIEKNIREQIIALMKREVVPAVGCTEPMAVALCVSRATEALECRPEKITALLSANILKNAMGVGIPGTGMIGLPIAIALGAIIGKSEYQLEVIKDVCPEAIEQGKQYIDEGRIDIQLKQGECDKLYVEILCEGDGHTASAIISGSHTHFVKVTRDDKVLLDELAGRSNDVDDGDIELKLRLVYDFAMQALPGQDHGQAIESRHLWQHHLLPHPLQDRTGHRCPHGRSADSRNEQQRFGQPGHLRHQSRRRLCHGEREHRGGAHPCPHAEPPHRHLHQAEPGQTERPVRLCGGLDWQLVWHHLPDGRRL